MKMKVFNESSDIDTKRGTVVTVGTFDGVHEGHKALIEVLLNVSYKTNLEHFIVTFEPHPRQVLNKDANIKLITTHKEKLKILEKYAIENLLVINFTEEFSKLSYEEFFKKYIIEKLNVTFFIIGHDHKFGKNREGDQEKLKNLADKYGFSIVSVPALEVDGVPISSTVIRHALQTGDMEKANFFLGRNFNFEGVVIEGKKRGRELGFPTINLKVADEKIIPCNGVYAVTCKVNNKIYFGMMNIGNRPTFNDNENVTIEINLFDFNQDIYGETVSVDVYDYIREEMHFSKKEDLIEQLNIDKATIKNYLSINFEK